MNGDILPWGAVTLTVAGFALSWVCYSLRGFSYSRLEEISTKRNRKDRFSQILRRSDDALLICEILWMLAITSAVGLFVAWFAKLDALENAAESAATLTWLVRLLFLILLGGALWIVGPWTLSRVCGEQLLFFAWPGIRGVSILFRGVLSFSSYFDRVLHRLAGLEEPSENDAESLDEEIRTVIDEGHTEGVLEAGARTMIHRVMDLGEHDVATIMTPRTDMFCISENVSLDEAQRQFIEAAHSRVPVIGKSTDDIIGVLYAKDLLKALHENFGNGSHVGGTLKIREIVREPFYVPETTRIDTLLETMKRDHVHLAIVLDEYGGVVGLVTLEDILEEIVGEIDDEFDEEQEAPQIVTLSPDKMEIDARVRIDDLNDRFDFQFPDDGDYDTLGGFVTERMGRVPRAGEQIVWNHLRITVLKADKRKIEKIRVEIDKSLATADQTDD